MINKSSPVQVQGFTNKFAQTPNLVSSSWSQLGVGDGYNIAIKTDGTLWGWGRNDYGQLGLDNGTLVKVSSPVQIGTSSWNFISVGPNSTSAIRSDGLMFQWGLNNNNQLTSSNIVSYWSKMAAGSNHFLAIKNDGSLWAWGVGSSGQLGNTVALNASSPIMIDNGSWNSVAAADITSFALRNDNTLWGWGYNGFGELADNTIVSKSSPVQISGSWSSISAGGNQSAYGSILGIKIDGTVWGWGYNLYGQLGDNSTINRSSPVQIAGVAKGISFSSVSSGPFHHALGIDTSGRLWSWGRNDYGQLGDGTTITRSSPVQVSAQTLFSTAAAGAYLSTALTVDKKLFTWGYNNFGQLGDNTNISKSNPVQVGNSSWSAIAASNYFSAGVDITGKLFTWGYNNAGQLGLNNTITYSSPVQVGTSSYTNVISSSANNRNNLAYLTSQGQWFASGDGTGSTNGGNPNNVISSNSSPVQIGVLPIVLSPTQIGTSSWTSVASGFSHSVAVRSDGTLWGWGQNNLGQLGSVALGGQAILNSPVQITSTSDYTTVTAGNNFTIASKSDGTIYAWGVNTYGQTGNTTTPLTNYSWRSLGATGYSFYAIRDDYKLFAWGVNNAGQLADNSTINRSSPVQIGNESWLQVTGGFSTVAAIKADSTLWTWGVNNVGQIGDGTVISRSSPVQVPGSWSQVYPGYSTVIALRTDNTLWGWGYGANTLGHLFGVDGSNQSSPVQIGNRSWSKIGIGFSHIIGLDTLGNLFTWGSNIYGQLGDNTTINKNGPVPLYTGKSWTNVFATQFQSYAIDSNNLLYGWGLNIQQGYGWGIGDGTSITRSSPVQIGTNKWKKVYNSVGYGFITSSNDNPATIFVDENDKMYAANSSVLSGYVWGRFYNTTVQASYTQLTSGDQASAMLRSDGRIFSTGLNTIGQIGDVTTINRSSPVQIGSGATVTEGELWRNIQMPRSASVAIRGDWKLYSWGSNSWYILGTGANDTVARSSPVQISTLNKSWIQLSARYSHAVGITTDGMLYGWGTNTYNALGIPFSWSQISAGASNTLFLRSDGTLYATGAGTSGMAGDNTVVSKSTLTQISSEKFIKITAGLLNTNAAISQTYKLFTWGANNLGQLGDGTTINKSSPVQIGSSSWLQVSIAANAVLAIRSDGTLWAWGQNNSNIFGSQVSANLLSSPVQIGTSSWIAISANSDTTTTAIQHGMGIDVNNALYTWGDNRYGQLGLGYLSSQQVWSTAVLGNNSFAIKNDGTVWTWGNVTGMYGSLIDSTTSRRSEPIQITTVAKSITRLATNRSAVFVVASDGTLYGWGNNSSGNLGIPVSWKSIGLGNGDYVTAYVVGVRSDGTLWGWGSNNLYQLGLGDTVFRSSPVQIGAGGNWASAYAGNYTSFAINELGQVFGWGLSDYGQVGNNTSGAGNNITSPVQIGTSYSWVSVANAQHTIGLTTNGLILSWGYNGQGQLGLNDVNNRSNPTQVGIGNSFVQVAAGRWPTGGVGFSMAIDSYGRLFAWGANAYGQLGDSTTLNRSNPVQIGNSSWSFVSADQLNVAALRSDGSLYVWGSANQTMGVPLFYGNMIGINKYRIYTLNRENTLYAAGYNSDSYIGISGYPVQATNSIPAVLTANANKSFVLINAKDYRTNIAIDTTGKLWTWGNNTYGTLGNNTTTNATSPIQIGNDSWIFATTNYLASYGIKSDYTLWAWGRDVNGNLGQNTVNINYSSPVQIAGSWMAMDANQRADAGAAAAGIKIDGTLWTWGDNDTGNLGLNDRINRSSPVQVPGSWLSVSVGGYSMLAIKSDRTLWFWGNSGAGEAGSNSTVARSSPVQVGTSSWSVVSNGAGSVIGAITIDGKLFTWGYNTYGQLGQGDIITRSSPVQVGTSSWSFINTNDSCAAAIDTNNRVFVWGFNGYGQIGDNTVQHRSSPVQVATQMTGISRSSPFQLSTKAYSKVNIGPSDVVLIDTSNKLFVYGRNSAGELGLNDTIIRNFPTAIDTGATYSNAYVTNTISFRLRSDNVLFGSGTNTSLLSDGTTVNRSSPVQVTGTIYQLPYTFSGSWNSVAIGYGFGAAVSSNGTLWTWGTNTEGQLGTNVSISTIAQTFTQVGSLSNWSTVNTGWNHIIATKTDSTIWTWGRNNFGQLGDNTIIDRSSPVQILSGASWTTVKAGGNLTFAIRTDGSLWSWGYNNNGTLGDGTTNSRSSPVQVGTSSWSNVNTYNNHVLAIRSDSTLWAWGSNVTGRLGDNTTISKSSPIQVGSLNGWSFFQNSDPQKDWITAFDKTSYAINNNILYGWGSNNEATSNFPINNVGASYSSPVQITGNYTSTFPITKIGNSSWSQISAGAGHSLAIRSDGGLYAWGLNASGQVTAIGNFVQLNTSGGLIKSDGVLYVWGTNNLGQLGDNSVVNRNSGVSWTYSPAPGSMSWSLASNSNTHGLYLNSDGSIWAAGNSTNSSYGDTGFLNRSSPVQVATGFSFVSIATSNYYSLAVRSDGQLWGVGFNTVGQLGNGTATNLGTWGQLTTGSWSQVFAGWGGFTSFAIRTDGTLWSTGYNALGELGQNISSVSTSAWAQVPGSWTTIATGGNTSASTGATVFGIKSDGTLWAWGRNNEGALGDGTTISKSSPIQIGTGTYSAVVDTGFGFAAWTTTGNVFVCGSNANGQLGDGTTINKSNPIQIPGTWKIYQKPQLGAGGLLLVDNSNNVFFTGSIAAATRSSPTQVSSLSQTVMPLTVNTNSPIQIGSSSWTQVQAGSSISSAIDSTNRLFTWGLNSGGQLGQNDTVSRSSPVQVGTSSWASISASGSTLVGLSNNRLFGWGFNTSGQAGTGNTTTYSSPVQIGSTTSTTIVLPSLISESSFSQVSSGQDYTIAIKTDGTLWGWGHNYFGQANPSLRTISSVLFVGGVHAKLALINGTLYGQGSNIYGNYGNNTILATSDLSSVQSTVSYSVIAYKYGITNGIRTDGTLWGWGYNPIGALGDGTTINRSSPVQIGSATNWTNAFGGLETNAYVNNANQLYIAGRNNFGQLGDGTTINRSSPVQVAGSWSSVSLGFNGTLGIKTDGTLWGWGDNQYGQLGTIPTWVDFASGTQFIVGIKSDGSLWTWGYNPQGNLGDGTTVTRSSPVQIGTSSWTKVAAANTYAFAIRSDGTLWGWGDGSNGRLGTNNTISRSSPVQIGTSSWTKVFAIGSSAGAIDINNTLWTWGDNSAGILGDGSTITRSSPVQIPGSWSTISIATQRMVGIKSDSTLWAWGNNTSGSFGDGTTVYRSSPVQIGTSSWSQVSAGRQHTLGITIDNDLYAWGLNASGQLGDNTIVSKSSPVQIQTGIKYSYIYSIYDSSFGKPAATNLLHAWGLNTNGMLGTNNITSYSTPTVVFGAATQNFSKLSSDNTNSSTATFALNSQDNVLSGWGNIQAQYFGPNFGVRSSAVQIPSAPNVSSPVQVGSKTNWTKVVTSGSHAMALDSTGDVFIWGYNNFGQLGDGTTIARSVPVNIGKRYIDFELSDNNGSTFGIMKDGTLWGWGINSLGQLGNNTVVARSIPTQVFGGYFFKSVFNSQGAVSAVANDNSLLAWGTVPTPFGTTYRSAPIQIGLGAAITSLSSPTQITSGSWSQISAGASHAFAVKTDGTLYAWGSNLQGRAGMVEYFSNSSNIMPVYASMVEYNSAYLLNDGTLWLAGSNTYGAMGDNTVTAKSSPVQVPGSWVSVGMGSEYQSAFAVRSDYTLWAWGRNDGGRLGDFTIISRSNPVQIMPTVSWSSVAANNLTAYAIATDGKLYTWGAGTSFDLGRGYGLGSVPTQIMSGMSFSQVAAGFSSGYAIATDSTLWAWGYNSVGNLGDGTTLNRSNPVQIPGSWNYVATWTYAGYGAGALGIKTDGTIWGWGVNTNYGKLGQNDTINRSSPVQLAAGNSWIHGAINDYNTYLIDSSYNLYGMGYSAYMNGEAGYNTSSPVQIGANVVPGSGWHKVFANGQSATLMINRDGSAWVMGNNPNTALGLGTTTASVSTLTKPALGLFKLNDYNNTLFSSPVQVSTTVSVSWNSVSAGQSHSVVTDNLSRLYTWGANTYGQLGDNTTTGKNAPLQIGASSWTSVAAGYDTTMATWPTAQIYAWGYNNAGQIGDNTTINRSSPVQVSTTSYTGAVLTPMIPDPMSGLQIVDATTAYNNKVFINKSNNLMYSYGGGTYGLNGQNTSENFYSSATLVSNKIAISNYSPTQIPGSYSLISAGKQHALATKSDGTLYTWGSYQNAKSLKQPYKMVVTGFPEATYAAIRGDDTLWMWGYNLNGTLGQNDTIFRSSPVQVPGSWSTIAVSSYYVLAIKTDGTLWGWGLNAYGNLGTNDLVVRSSPVQVGTSSWSMIALNYFYCSAGIDINGRLYRWGYNSTGNIGDGTVISKSSPVQIGSSSWTFISMSPYHTVAINKDNLLFTWGSNNYGQLGDGTTIAKSSPVQIGTLKYKKAMASSSANEFTLALRGDGVLFGSGVNNNYQLGDGTVINRSSPVQVASSVLFKDIANGFMSTPMAIAIDDTVYSWGYYIYNWFNNTSNDTRSAPVQVKTPTTTYGTTPLTAKSISINATNLLYIGLDNEMYGAGYDTSGAMTYYGAQTYTNTPVVAGVYGTSSPVQLNSGVWTNVSAGNETSAGINNQALYFWGRNTNYQSGIKTNNTQISSPTVVIASRAVSTGSNTNNTGGISNG